MGNLENMTNQNLKGVFVTGTDTDVGKSVACAWLVRQLKADYWKPVQSGLSGETDTQAILRMADIEQSRFHPATYELQQPLSPHESARRDGVEISLERFTLPNSSNPIVVEGAGGVMVPLNDRDFMIDLMAHLSLPVIVVARSQLGTINHTLLTLMALRSRNIPIQGVIINGPANEANYQALAEFSHVPILAHIPWLDTISAEALDLISPISQLY